MQVLNHPVVVRILAIIVPSSCIVNAWRLFINFKFSTFDEVNSIYPWLILSIDILISNELPFFHVVTNPLYGIVSQLGKNSKFFKEWNLFSHNLLFMDAKHVGKVIPTESSKSAWIFANNASCPILVPDERSFTKRATHLDLANGLVHPNVNELLVVRVDHSVDGFLGRVITNRYSLIQRLFHFLF